MYKVRVPIDQKPRFPQQCAVCGEAQPDSHYHLVSGNAFTDLISGWQTRASQADCNVPACKACARGWAWRRRSHWMVMAMIAVALVFGMKLIWPMLPEDWVPKNSKAVKLVLFLALMVMGLPLAGFIKMLIPVPVALLSHPQYLEFEFQSPEYGMQFDDGNNLIDVDDRFSALEEEDDFEERLAGLYKEESQELDE